MNATQAVIKEIIEQITKNPTAVEYMLMGTCCFHMITNPKMIAIQEKAAENPIV